MRLTANEVYPLKVSEVQILSFLPVNFLERFSRRTLQNEIALDGVIPVNGVSAQPFFINSVSASGVGMSWVRKPFSLSSAACCSGLLSKVALLMDAGYVRASMAIAVRC